MQVFTVYIITVFYISSYSSERLLTVLETAGNLFKDPHLWLGRQYVYKNNNVQIPIVSFKLIYLRLSKREHRKDAADKDSDVSQKLMLS